MKKILITGITGYIGSKTATHLKSLNYEIHGISRKKKKKSGYIMHKYTCIKSLHTVFKKNKFEYIIHLAGFNGLNTSYEDITNTIKGNLDFSLELFEVMAKFNSKKIVYATTFWDKTEKNIPNSLYALTKDLTKKSLDYYHYKYGFSVITLRLFDVFGPADSRNKIFNRLQDKTSVLETTPGLQMIYPTHINDITVSIAKATKMINKTKKLEYDVRAKGYPLKLAINKFLIDNAINKEIKHSLPYPIDQIFKPVLKKRFPIEYKRDLKL